MRKAVISSTGLTVALALSLVLGCQTAPPAAPQARVPAPAAAPVPAATPPTVAPPPASTVADVRLLGDDAASLAELSRLYQAVRPFGHLGPDGQWWAPTADQLAQYRACFLKLLDYYYFTADRLTGMTRAQVQTIFGRGLRDDASPDGRPRYTWTDGRDYLVVEFTDHRATLVAYIAGF